jgi:hypothetical protein
VIKSVRRLSQMTMTTRFIVVLLRGGRSPRSRIHCRG